MKNLSAEIFIKCGWCRLVLIDILYGMLSNRLLVDNSVDITKCVLSAFIA